VLDEPTSEVAASVRSLATKFIGQVEFAEPQVIPTVIRKRFRLFSRS